MKQITTDDNSTTFYNETYQETYHSKSGADQESIKKFVEPTKHKSNPNILDICFGLGYNSAAALDEFKDCNIIALENDKNILNQTQNITSNFKSYKEIQQASKNLKSEHIELILGDARDTIKGLKDNYFDIIFLDPFSPKKCPELWTQEFFKILYKKAKKGAILTTYSCARIVRENLKEAHFNVKNGPSIGRKAPSTIATKPL